MKVLLTGASGFVGSHILDSLRARKLDCVLLLRRSSDRSFIQHHLQDVEIRTGGIDDPLAVRSALSGVTHVIHCAGSTRAARVQDYYRSNHTGTRNVVEAVNAAGSQTERFLHISSLAVAGPATAAKPAQENTAPCPVSDYGKSKLAGEMEVRLSAQIPFTVIRPPAVYGPRDKGFLSMFQAVHAHCLPRPSATQELSLVYVKDLAEAVVACLLHPAAAGKTYFVSSKQIVTARSMAKEIAAQMRRWTIPLPLVPALLWPVCLSQEIVSRLTGKPTLLNLQKYAELKAPGWVCDASLLTRETGCECPTPLAEGIAQTLKWYTDQGWL